VLREPVQIPSLLTIDLGRCTVPTRCSTLDFLEGSHDHDQRYTPGAGGSFVCPFVCFLVCAAQKLQ
jgi:hypothetical protein